MWRSKAALAGYHIGRQWPRACGARLPFVQDMVGMPFFHSRRPGPEGQPSFVAQALSRALIPRAMRKIECVSRYPGCEPAHRGVLALLASRNDGDPLPRKPVRPALLHRTLERRPRVHSREPRRQVRIRPELVEHFRHLADKAHLDVGAGQRVADEELAPLQRAVDIAEMIFGFTVDPRMQRRACLFQPGDVRFSISGSIAEPSE